MTSSAVLLTAPGGFRVTSYDGTGEVAPVSLPKRELFDLWVRTPANQGEHQRTLQRSVREILEATGWSRRKLAVILGTTHPTVTSILTGRSPLRVDGLVGRVASTHEVVQRIHIAAGRDRVMTDYAINEPVGQNGESAADHLAMNSFSTAYLKAIDVLNPPQSEGMMESIWPAQHGQATHSLSDEF